MSARRLLVVTYYYPPQPGSGSNRWAALAKYLRRLGHDVTVLTAAPPGHSPAAAEGVVRTANLNSNPLLRRVLLRGARPEPSSSVAGSEDVPPGVMPPVLWKVFVPDPWLISWNPAARRALRRLLREARFDCVVSSSPAMSTHLLPLALGRRRPAWIAEFRDGWTFEPLVPPFPTRPQRALNAWLERRTVTTADAVVAATAPIAEDFRARFGVRTWLVSNGFDPELGSGPPLPAADAHRMSFVHTGGLVGPWRRDARPLLKALRRLIETDPGLAERVELVVAGRPEGDEAALLENAGLGDVVRRCGYLPRDEALALQRAAGALVLITSRNRGEATGKLYEYMAARRPVIALAEGNEAARIVAETNIGVSVAPDDVDAIAGALRRAISGELERAYAPRGTENYAYPLLAERMASVIDAAIERRAAAPIARAAQDDDPSRR